MNKFCFVIHPLSFDDIARYEPGAKGKGEPILRKIMEWMPSYAAVHVTGVRAPDGRETEGWFVAAPLLPQQLIEFPREEVYRRVLGAIEIGARARRAGRGPRRVHRRRRRRGRHDQRALADSRDDRQLADDRRRRAESVSRRAGDGDRSVVVDGGRRSARPARSAPRACS